MIIHGKFFLLFDNLINGFDRIINALIIAVCISMNGNFNSFFTIACNVIATE